MARRTCSLLRDDDDEDDDDDAAARGSRQGEERSELYMGSSLSWHIH